MPPGDTGGWRGLDETATAAARLRRSGPRRLSEALDDSSRRVGAEAKRRARSTSRAAPSSTSWIRHATASAVSSIVLDPAGDRRAYATEFGMHRAFLWGRRSLQSRLKRRTFAPFRGAGFSVARASGPGYVIHAAIRDRLDTETDLIVAAVADVVADELDRAGVPHG